MLYLEPYSTEKVAARMEQIRAMLNEVFSYTGIQECFPACFQSSLSWPHRASNVERDLSIRHSVLLHALDSACIETRCKARDQRWLIEDLRSLHV